MAKEKPLKCQLSKTELIRLRAAIAEISLPTWVDGPPRNLGEASHGKLKADTVFILFTVVLPMVCVEMWGDGDDERRTRMLGNLMALVSCLNISCSYTTNDTAAADFERLFVSYLRSMQELFPHAHLVPNHHYALHIPEHLRYWGSLMALSEWFYERTNGQLQRIKTNSQIEQLDLTILRQFCRTTRLYVQSACRPSTGSLSRLALLLYGKRAQIEGDASVDQHALRQFNRHGKKLSDPDYDAILHHLRTRAALSHLRHRKDLNAAGEALTPLAQPAIKFELDKRIYSTESTQFSNSCIAFFFDGQRLFGRIQRIFEQVVAGTKHTHVFIRPFARLSFEDEADDFFARYAHCSCFLAYDRLEEKCIVTAPKDIISHVAVWARPAGSFSISQRTVAMHMLDRGRRHHIFAGLYN